MQQNNVLKDVLLNGGKVNSTNQEQGGVPPFSIVLPKNAPGLEENVRKFYPNYTIVNANS